MRKTGKLAACIGVLAMSLVCLSVCGARETGGGKSGEEGNGTGGGTETAISGSIRMVGSTSMEKYANALAEGFMDQYPDVEVTAEFAGSGAGIMAVVSGTADIGNSSRHLKDEEKEAGAVENIVAIDGIAVCVHRDSAVNNLSRQQLVAIYTGAVTNWSEVGGTDLPMVVVGREAGSGARGAFEMLLGVEGACAYINELDSAGAVMAKVASTPGAIGYVSLDVVNDSVSVLSLEGVEPTADNIRAGSYLLVTPFVMATRGEIADQSPLVQAWFRYVLGEEGRKVAAGVGLVPGADMECENDDLCR